MPEMPPTSLVPASPLRSVSAPSVAPSVVTWSADDPAYDGDWWPASSDIVAERSAVLPLVQSQAGHVITRVTLDMGAWPEPHPRRLVGASQLVRIGWFPRLPLSIATFGQATSPRIVLHLNGTPSADRTCEEAP